MQQQRQDADLPAIPLELHDNIISFLWDDQPTLSACSLVARAWLPAARSHKFHTLCLQSCYRRSSFEELLDSALLNSHGLTRYVRELRIGVDPQDNAVCEPKLQRAVWHDLGLIRLIRELTSLEVLHLENLWWDPSLLSQEMAELLLAYTRKVKHLHISSVAFLHMGDMLRVLLSAPGLARASLVLSWCSADSHSIPAASLAEFAGREVRLGRVVADPASYVGLCMAVYRSVLAHTQMEVSIDTLTLAAGDRQRRFMLHETVAFLSRTYEEVFRRRLDLSDGQAPVTWTFGETSVPSTFIRVNALDVDLRDGDEHFARSVVDLFNIGVLRARHVRFHFGASSPCWDWDVEGRLDDALLQLAQEDADLEIDFCVETAQDPVRMAEWVGAMETRLFQFLESGAHAKLLCVVKTCTGHCYTLEHRWS